MLFTRSLNSVTSTLNQASDITKVEEYLSSGDILFTDLVTKPEFLLGDSTLDAGQAVIRVIADVTGQPLAQDHYVIVVSDSQEAIDVTGDKKIGIMIDQTFVNNATSVTSNLGLGLAQIFSTAARPTEPHIKLWEVTAGDWAGATDLRAGLILDGTKIDLSNYNGDISADTINVNTLIGGDIIGDTLVIDGEDIVAAIDAISNNFKVMSILKTAGEDLTKGMIVRYEVGDNLAYETYSDATNPCGQLVGIVTDDYLLGEEAKIDIVGVSEVYTGLSQGMDYYLAESGFFDDSTGGIQISQNNIQKGIGYVSGNSMVFDGSGATGVTYNFFNLLYPQGDPSLVSRIVFDIVVNFWVKTTDSNSRLYHISMEKMTAGDDLTEVFFDLTAAGLVRVNGLASLGQDLINNPNGYIQSITQVNDNNWHMVQVRYNSVVSQWEIYVDNVLEETGNNTDSGTTYRFNASIPNLDLYETIGDGHIGRNTIDYSGTPFTGEIDSFTMSARITGTQPDPTLIDFWNGGAGLPYTPTELFTYYLAFDITKPNITTNNRNGIFVGNAWSDTEFKMDLPVSQKNLCSNIQEHPPFTFATGIAGTVFAEGSLFPITGAGRYQLNIGFTLDNSGGNACVSDLRVLAEGDVPNLGGTNGSLIHTYLQTATEPGKLPFNETRVIELLDGDQLFFNIEQGEIDVNYFQILPIKD